MLQEEWKDIAGYEGLYQISSHGNVRSVPRKGTRGGAVLASYGSSGYLQTHLCRDGIAKTFQVHRIVATHFLENPYELPEVNHKDENKTNNHADNLEWCDRIYNQNFGTAIERMVANHNYAESAKKSAAHHDYKEVGRKQGRRVLQIDAGGNIVKRWDSIRSAAAHFGNSPGNIVAACKGRYKESCGYRWEYEEEIV